MTILLLAIFACRFEQTISGLEVEIRLSKARITVDEAKRFLGLEEAKLGPLIGSSFGGSINYRLSPLGEITLYYTNDMAGERYVQSVKIGGPSP